MTEHSLTIEEQVIAMKAAWPGFSVRGLNRQAKASRWTGEVRPQFTRYKLDIRYRIGDFPEVRVLRPELVRLPDNIEGVLPHIYPPLEDPTLCLFDPAEKQWNPSMAIAYTTLPWACDWLACYEFWLMTGRWTGGGRHASVDALSGLVQ